ncbi:PAS domain-containing protein [Hymenobacter humi]|uniref:histidine kinase n=1 Tax=Hymenobacter humi TaxID=1411620 RepID=A0ABW2U2H4_9BACT
MPLTISTMEGPDLTFTFLSDRARKAMGPRVALGRTVAESLPEITAQGYLQFLQQVRDSGQAHFGHEERTEIQDPESGELQEHYHNFGYLPLQGESGPGVLAYGLNVTEQVQARLRNEALAAEAQAADQRLRHVTESLPSITFISNQEGQVLYVSPQWYAYTGTTAADDLDRVWQDRVHPDDAARVRQDYAAALASGTPWRYEPAPAPPRRRVPLVYKPGRARALEEARAAGRSRQWFGSDLDIHEPARNPAPPRSQRPAAQPDSEPEPGPDCHRGRPRPPLHLHQRRLQRA